MNLIISTSLYGCSISCRSCFTRYFPSTTAQGKLAHEAVLSIVPLTRQAHHERDVFNDPAHGELVKYSMFKRFQSDTNYLIIDLCDYGLMYQEYSMVVPMIL
jgi:hypothetical protein